MSPAREAIHVALLERLKSCAEFNLVSRRLKLFDEVAPEQCPALYLTGGSDTSIVASQSISWGSAVEHKLSFEVTIQTYSDLDSEVSPSTYLNPLIDAVVNLFSTEQEEDTLGGLVEYVVIDPNTPIVTDCGIYDPIAQAVIPLIVVF